jgi:hypothetical protein
LGHSGNRLTFEIYEIVRITDGRIAERMGRDNPSVPELVQQLREHT